MIYWACKRCAEGLEAPECLAGDKLRCPKCKRLCRVPSVAQNNSAEEAHLCVGAMVAATANGAHAEAPHNEAFVNSAQESAVQETESPQAPETFAASRISQDAGVVIAPEVAAEEVVDDRLPLIEVASDIARSPASDVNVFEFAPIAEIPSVVEEPAASDLRVDSMSEMIADAVDDDLHAHATTNGVHGKTLTESAAGLAAATSVNGQELDQAQALERELEALAPLIQRQLGPAIAQYSSREQAKAAMFARAVVDVYPTRLSVQSHEPGRIVLNVRYRRILRRTMIGTKNLPDMTVEATFVNDADSWSLDRWQKTVTV